MCRVIPCSARALKVNIFFDVDIVVKKHRNVKIEIWFIVVCTLIDNEYTSKALVHAMITNRIDYCNSLLCGLPDNSLNKLQRVQNAAARLITGTAKFSHITPVLRTLHWLPIKQRVQFKMLILVFKAINGLAPNYISNLVNILCPSKYFLRRNDEILLEPYNGKTKKTLGDRALAVAAPRLFNSLPREIRHETCFNTFKTKVKTFLFRTLTLTCYSLFLH